MDNYDVIVIGGGVVGLATAWALSERFPQRRVALVEKEAGLARHQTGHNSGVLHSGIYYKPGSLKAATCRAGREAMIAFCQQEGIAYELCGKVIVALDQAELGRLHDLAGRGVANGVDCELISAAHLHELEAAPAGVRAQAIAPDGRPLDDFAFAETARIIHVINAPSPAATAALSIGQFIAGKVAERTGPPSPP